jgi:hypothetical protein
MSIDGLHDVRLSFKAREKKEGKKLNFVYTSEVITKKERKNKKINELLP